MLWNPGILPDRWTVARLKTIHPSRPFNPDLANAFFRAGLTEAWGRSIERIMDACRAAGVDMPRLRYASSGLWVEFGFPQGYVAVTTQETTQEKILSLLKAKPSLTRRELAARIGLTPDGIKYHLEKLGAAGSIRHVGPTKAGRWEVLT